MTFASPPPIVEFQFGLFRYKAVVDWLVLEIRTIRPIPAWRIKKSGNGAFSYVTGLHPITGEEIALTESQRENTPTTRFALRIQNPERYELIRVALDTVQYLDQSIETKVRGIEIAFDAHRLPGTTHEQLASMVEKMLRGINRPENTNVAPRFYSFKGTPELRFGEESVLSAVRQGFTAMYGNKEDPFIIRGYLKDYDSMLDDKGKSYRATLTNPLAHRARIEVRLQDEACPVQTLNDLKSFRFDSLAHFFKFRAPSASLRGIEALVATKRSSNGGIIQQSGDLEDSHANRGRARKTASGSQASPLNEIARDRLRKLSGRWICATGRGKAPKTQKYDGDSGCLPAIGPSVIQSPSTTQKYAEDPCESRVSAPSVISSNARRDVQNVTAVLNTSLHDSLDHLPASKSQSIAPEQTNSCSASAMGGESPGCKVLPVDAVSNNNMEIIVCTPTN